MRQFIPSEEPVVGRRPRWTRTYRHRLLDAGRWNAYTPRDDDIIVCSLPKAGTTWMQMVCALLVFQSPAFPAPLPELSPWFELPNRPVADVVARLEGQTHRRVIKTHLPLDGLPWHQAPTYLFIARDPRDICLSLARHIASGHPDARLLNGLPFWPFDEIPDDRLAFFRKWITTPGVVGEQDGWPAWSVLDQAATYWRHRGLPNLHLFHYADLKADLDGQMRRVSHLLGIPVDERHWPRLVDAARFASMKQRASQLVPAWRRDPAAFFAKGEVGEFEGVLGAVELALYRRAMAERVAPDLADWLENGGLARLEAPGAPASLPG